MKTNKTTCVLSIALTTLLFTSFTDAKEAPTPKYAADVPDFLLTPEKATMSCYDSMAHWNHGSIKPGFRVILN